VEHAEEADLGAEVARIRGDFQERCGAGLEEQAVDEALVLGKWCQWVGECKDHMNVANGEEFLAPLSQPAVACTGLTLGAVPVSTRVIRDGTMAAAKAAITMAAQGGGAATRDRVQHLPLRPGQPGPSPCDEALTLGANDIGHLKGGPDHCFLCSLREW
jgi:hypothetical protein